MSPLIQSHMGFAAARHLHRSLCFTAWMLIVVLPFEKPVRADDEALPQKPTAPPLMQKRTFLDTFACDRKALYKGKSIGCDSVIRRDSENLRSILLKKPVALAELDAYQDGRRNRYLPAYIGTAGIAIAGIGWIIGHQFEGSQGIAIRNSIAALGLATTASSTFYGLGYLRGNESHLSNAVVLYNRGNTSDPIEPQFTLDDYEQNRDFMSALWVTSLAGAGGAAAAYVLGRKISGPSGSTFFDIVTAAGVVLTLTSASYALGISHANTAPPNEKDRQARWNFGTDGSKVLLTTSFFF